MHLFRSVDKGESEVGRSSRYIRGSDLPPNHITAPGASRAELWYCWIDMEADRDRGDDCPQTAGDRPSIIFGNDSIHRRLWIAEG
jgi:hypothetical protein